jgi:hypothetical protein
MQKTEFGIWKIFDCEKHKAKGFDSCFGINDATIYGFPILFNDKFKASKNKKDLGPMFQLKKNEALVIIGKTPPPCLYWGFTPYLHKRKYENEESYTTVNASLSDTLNHKKFAEMFNLESPFQKPFMLIIGQNPRVNEQIYQKDSFPQLEKINKLNMKNFTKYHKMILPLPSEQMRDDDIVTVLSRVTYINPDYMQTYKEQPGLFCFKVTVNLSSIFLGPGYPSEKSFMPIGVPQPDPKSFYLLQRDNNIEETQFIINTENNSTVENVINLYRDISSKKGLLPVDVKLFSVSLDNPEFPIDTGFDCIKNRYDCFFDNRDTVYSVTRPILTKDAPNGIIICGVNHQNTKKALYTNINIYDGDEFTPIFDLLISPQKQPVFVKKGIIVRNNKYFYEIIIPNDFYRTHQKIFIAERAYLQSIISPSFNSIVYPLVFILPYSKSDTNRYNCNQ